MANLAPHCSLPWAQRAIMGVAGSVAESPLMSYLTSEFGRVAKNQKALSLHQVQQLQPPQELVGSAEFRPARVDQLRVDQLWACFGQVEFGSIHAWLRMSKSGLGPASFGRVRSMLGSLRQMLCGVRALLSLKPGHRGLRLVFASEMGAMQILGRSASSIIYPSGGGRRVIESDRRSRRSDRTQLGLC